MSTTDKTYQVGVSTIALVAGATPTQFQLANVPGARGVVIKRISGGSLSITNSYAALTGYLMGDTEAFSINGPARFFLAATGATCVAALAINYGQGTSLFPG